MLESVLHSESLKSWNGSETLKLRMIHNYSNEIEKRLKTLNPEKKLKKIKKLFKLLDTICYIM